MAKLTVYHKISALLPAMLCFVITVCAQVRLEYHGVDRNAAVLTDSLKLKQRFTDSADCREYILALPGMLVQRGFATASVDSFSVSASAAYCEIYLGDRIRYTHLRTDSIDPAILQSIGWHRMGKRMSFVKFEDVREKVLDHLENSGYPFARVSIDSVDMSNDSMYAVLRVEKGPLYRIDSIRNYGTGSISPGFLQQYLGIINGSTYNKSRLRDVSTRIRELPYLQEKKAWDLTLLGTGSVLNVYLDPKKASEVNVLVGLLPANEQLADNKMLVTGDANINLKNALGGGETIGVNWQQIQVKSPRLNLLFQQPYLFGSPFGLNFSFDLLKKDSSWLNINMLAGASYAVSARQTGSVFLQRFTTNLLNVDTNAVKSQKRLPAEADLSSVSLGVNYELFTTDYRFNPRRGNEFFIGASAGTKTIRKNNAIVKLFDNADPPFDYNSLYDTVELKSYQFRLNVRAAHYFPIGKISVIKTAFNGGWFQSPNIFRNELYQIGGYKLLRGFDEESIFASMYGVGTAEYRYLIGQNSFLSAFVDYGRTTNKSYGRNRQNRFLGAGLGMAFETKAGIFNFSVAAGKRGDADFNLRQSKIHVGYVNYF